MMGSRVHGFEQMGTEEMNLQPEKCGRGYGEGNGRSVEVIESFRF